MIRRNKKLNLVIILSIWIWISPCLATTNISCVGDSNTYGYGLPDRLLESYPAKLQQLLGSNYQVNNFGQNAMTMLKDADYSYWNTSNYNNSRTSPVPDIVIIMLGTNDSRWQSWDLYGTNFITDYEAMIDSYTELDTNPRVLICTVPPVFGNGNWDINPGLIATNIVPQIRELGSNRGVQVIDIYALCEGHTEWFSSDLVHLNSEGTSVMAAYVYKALLGDSTNEVLPTLEINSSSEGSIALEFPADHGGYVLQSIPTLSTTNSWTVVGQPLMNEGTMLQMTKPVTQSSEMFRLWKPTN